MIPPLGHPLEDVCLARRPGGAAPMSADDCLRRDFARHRLERSVRETTLRAEDFCPAESGVVQFVKWLRLVCATFLSSRPGQVALARRFHPQPRSLQKIAREEIVRSALP